MAVKEHAGKRPKDFIQTFLPGDVVCITCDCRRQWHFRLITGRITAIHCPCGIWVGGGHDVIIAGSIDQYLKNLGI